MPPYSVITLSVTVVWKGSVSPNVTSTFKQNLKLRLRREQSKRQASEFIPFAIFLLIGVFGLALTNGFLLAVRETGICMPESFGQQIYASQLEPNSPAHKSG
ncbi:hypothetical protein AVEN_203322-1 [Araneus ventricosus]|uniref:Uncharacterized protein n=1 Tax=Araneus ventricosus TaxID=182803 RepID=A0A4Y2ER78_ARAVE|nr:hypothetical protein AVEN_203322-1 [Araneus ventricosus]